MAGGLGQHEHLEVIKLFVPISKMDMLPILQMTSPKPYAVILLPAHPASFAHKFLFQRVPGCNSIADLSLKIVFRTHKFAVGTH